MIRWLAPPKLAEVAKYIDCYWYLDTPDGGYERPKLNPDPSAHLILTLANQPYQYEISKSVFKGVGSHWLYPYSDTIELDHAKSFRCIGIKFNVGALYSLKSMAFSHTLLNSVKDVTNAKLSNILGVLEGMLLRKDKREPADCVTILDQYLLPLFADTLEDKHSELTRKILPLLADKPINTLGRLLFCSQRTLERSFLKVTGFTLKQCQSMNKLEAILQYLYQRKPSDIDWGDIAYQFGFSDQPHLIRYLKQQINLTPNHYSQQRGFTIDVYGGVTSN